MKVFVAGSTGAIGKSLLPKLIEKKYEVIALVRNKNKSKEVENLGAIPVTADALNKDELINAVKKAKPEVIIHQLTALSKSTGNFKKLDEDFELTNRFRTEVTDTLIEAARIAGTRRFIAQSFCGWPFAPEGSLIKTEEDPLDPNPPESFSKTLHAIKYLEDVIKNTKEVEAFALRYGFFYGPETGIAKNGIMEELIRKRKLPIVGSGEGIWSFIHIDDAAAATVNAISFGKPGIYNIVDDDPVQIKIWLPFLAEILKAKPPRKIPAWLAKFIIGEGGVSMMTKIRGASNAKAKQELNWKPKYSSWKQGFADEFG